MVSHISCQAASQAEARAGPPSHLLVIKLVRTIQETCLSSPSRRPARARAPAGPGRRPGAARLHRDCATGTTATVYRYTRLEDGIA